MEIASPSIGFWENKKVFLTGHTGFKGSWLTLMLKHLGAQVYGYAIDIPTEPSLYKLCKLENKIDSTIGDIRQLEKLSSSLRNSSPEIVIHMAAQPLVRLSYDSPVYTYETNVMGTVNLLEAIRSVKTVKAVVIVTTDKCYENKEWPWSYRENEPVGGFDPYSNSKGCAELVTNAYRSSFFNNNHYKTHGVAIATARAGNVIGGGDWAKDRLIPDFIKAIQKNQTIVIRNPKAIRPWQHVLEPLSGYLVLAEALFKKGVEFAEPWNFGPNDEDAKPVEWIVKRLCEIWGNNSKFEIDHNPQPHEANYLKLDCSKAKTYLNWHPRWSLNVALDSIIEFTHSYINKEDLEKVCIKQIERYLK